MEPIELHYTIPYFGRFVISNREVQGFDPAKPYLLKFRGEELGRFPTLAEAKYFIYTELHVIVDHIYDAYWDKNNVLTDFDLESYLD